MRLFTKKHQKSSIFTHISHTSLSSSTKLALPKFKSSEPADVTSAFVRKIRATEKEKTGPYEASALLKK